MTEQITEQNQTIIDFFVSIFRKAQIFLSRPDVQLQVMIIVGVLLLVWLISSALTFAINRWLAPQVQTFSADETSPKRFATRLLPGLKLLIYPIIALFFTSQAIAYVLAQGQVVGLLRLLTFILWILFIYRFIFGVLYLFFPEPDVSRFQSRLFGPLFGLFVGYYILSLFVNITVSANIVLATFFENPLTIGSVFLATFGLYFWINGVLWVNNVILIATSRFTAINTGRLEAFLSLIAYVLIGAGVVIVMGTLGVSSTTFAAITGGLSVGIGFALKEVLGNFISGLLLLSEGSIRPGDQILINDARGTVTKLKVSSTHVKLRDNKEVIVPNQQLLASSVVTYTGSDNMLRLELPIHTGYEKPPKEVRTILLEIAKNCPLILPHKAPKVFLFNLNEFGMDFRIRVFIDIDKYSPGTIYNDIYLRIWEAFEEQGIKVALPQRELHLLNDADEKWNFSPPTAQLVKETVSS